MKRKIEGFDIAIGVAVIAILGAIAFGAWHEPGPSITVLPADPAQDKLITVDLSAPGDVTIHTSKHMRILWQDGKFTVWCIDGREWLQIKDPAGPDFFAQVKGRRALSASQYVPCEVTP